MCPVCSFGSSRESVLAHVVKQRVWFSLIYRDKFPAPAASSSTGCPLPGMACPSIPFITWYPLWGLPTTSSTTWHCLIPPQLPIRPFETSGSSQVPPPLQFSCDSIPLFFRYFYATYGMWDLSSQTRDQTHALQWKHWTLTTGPPGNSLWQYSFWIFLSAPIHFF